MESFHLRSSLLTLADDKIQVTILQMIHTTNIFACTVLETGTPMYEFRSYNGSRQVGSSLHSCNLEVPGSKIARGTGQSFPLLSLVPPWECTDSKPIVKKATNASSQIVFK